ncbi:MAG: co-chaperone GroES [Planctomycetes bacterium]|nr:co-chaperone GroES [Planctomycetota bacterium]
MIVNRKKLFVVGDRVLVSPTRGEERTKVGLYLPATAVEKMAVQSGRVVEVGPGIPIPGPNEFADEPWKSFDGPTKAKYVPLEAQIGDVALFLRSAAVEIEFEGTSYLLVPHAAILLLVREPSEASTPNDPEFSEDDFRL